MLVVIYIGTFMANMYYLNQFFTTTLNVGGGIDGSQTTGIIITSVSGLDITKPGIALLSYTDPLNTANAEWVTYTSINGSNELQGVTRGGEGYSAKAHANGVAVAFPLSESHVNNLAAALSIGGVSTTGVTTTLDEDDMASNSATALSTQQSIKAYVDGRANTDGWISSSDTYVYVSATSFKITGADRTATFTKGTRIKLTQTSAKYFVVTSSSFSTDTTVNVTGGTDYTVANAAITSPYYSYSVNPQGFPGFFSYTPSEVGFSSTTILAGRFYVVGNEALVQVEVSGTSDTTGLTLSLPITAVALSANAYDGASGFSQNNGAALTTPARMAIETDLTVITCNRDMSGAAWTSSGTKSLRGTVMYRF